MASNDDIQRGQVGLIKSDLRPERLIAPGQTNEEDSTFKFRSRLLSELRDIKDAIIEAENHLQRIEALIEGTYTRQERKTSYRANTEAYSAPNDYRQENRGGAPIEVEVVKDSTRQTQEQKRLTYSEPKQLGYYNGGMIPSPDRGGSWLQSMMKWGGRLWDILNDRPLKNDRWGNAIDVEVLDPEQNLALQEKGYDTVDVEGRVPGMRPRKEKRWLRDIIGMGVALTGGGETDDTFGGAITDWVYKKFTGWSGGKDLWLEEAKKNQFKPDEEKSVWEKFKENASTGKKGWWQWYKEDIAGMDTGEPSADERQAKENAKYKGYKKWEEPGTFDVDEEGNVINPEQSMGATDIVEEEQHRDTVEELLKEINKRVQGIDPMTPDQMEGVLDKQRAEEDAVASMSERLDGQDIETDKYEEGFKRQEEKGDENQKGLLDSLSGIAELLGGSGPLLTAISGPLMGALTTIGSTVAVLGVAVGGFIAGWKLEEYLDEKFDIVNKSLNGIDNTLGTSLFHTEEEKREKAMEQVRENWGEQNVKFAESAQGAKANALDESIKALRAENVELEAKAKKGDKSAQKLLEHNLKRISDIEARQSELRTEYGIESGQLDEGAIQKEVQDLTEALENGTWEEILDAEGNKKYASKDKVEEALKINKQQLEKVQNLLQKKRNEEMQESMLKEGAEFDEAAEMMGSDEKMRNQWKAVLPDQTSKELPSGEPKLNPAPVPGVTDEKLTDLIGQNRKAENQKVLAEGLKQGAEMQESSLNHSSITDINGFTYGFDFLQDTKRETKEGDYLHFAPESKESMVTVYGKEADIPELGVVPQGFHRFEEGGRTRMDAIEDVEYNQDVNQHRMERNFEEALKGAYDFEREPVLSTKERETGNVQQGGYITLSSSHLNEQQQAVIEELKVVYAKRQEQLERLKAGLDNPEQGTYLGDELQKEYETNETALRMLNGELVEGHTPRLRYSRDIVEGTINKWEFGNFNPLIDWVPEQGEVQIKHLKEQPTQVEPDKEFTDDNVSYLANLLGMELEPIEPAKESEPIEPVKEPEPQYYEWNAPNNWDEFIESPLMRDVRKTVGTIYPYKGVSVSDLGDYDVLGEKLSQGAKSAWGAALSGAKVSPKPSNMTELESFGGYATGSVEESRSQKEIPGNISEEVRDYEDRKIELLEEVNNNLKKQRGGSVAVVGAGGGEGVASDMRMSIDDVGLSLVNMGFFD